MNPSYPVYVISKGRWESRLTSKALEKLGVPYRIVIEPQELDQYASVIDRAKILLLPFSNLGKGSIPARNWVWEHSMAEGHKRHWILDDNISAFRRVTDSTRFYIGDGTGFKVIEDFVDRYKNISLAGMQYSMFAGANMGVPIGKMRTDWSTKTQCHPVYFNTRIYSCILILNATPFRWRGRYNEDTDLSLRALKAGWCTALFYAFTCDKQRTMTMKGGNTDHLYKQNEAFDGRYEMAKSLWMQHPDVVKIVRKWGRWQHHVNYKPFLGNKLIPVDGIAVNDTPNDYGMKMVVK